MLRAVILPVRQRASPVGSFLFFSMDGQHTNTPKVRMGLTSAVYIHTTILGLTTLVLTNDLLANVEVTLCLFNTVFNVRVPAEFLVQVFRLIR